ncbi:MAG: hypothetical protein CML19_02110 [Pusillimonas sp.]|nr:hypothetical protein [Pusillimonas sp.]
MATLQQLVKSKKKVSWKDIPSKADDPKAYSKAVEGGVPVRVLHSTGSYKVIKNIDNLPEGMDNRFVA